ncbi:MAG: adenylate/guanylate cyclase domain-containing protein, partial [Spirochaetota bacterium]
VLAGSLFFLIIISVNTVLLIMRSAIKAQNKMLAISLRLNSYLPPQLVNSIIEGGTDSPMKIEKRKITVCFTDLQGFTALTERNRPELIQLVLNEYLTDMTTIAHAWGGMVDKFMGDGIMILFGAIEDIDEAQAALLCVRMAEAMQEHMKEMSYAWKSIGIETPLSMRAGIHTGFAAVGPYGPPDRQTFTAMGSTVNLASRLEGACTPGRILVSKSCYELINGNVPCGNLQNYTVKGFSSSVEAYEIGL